MTYSTTEDIVKGVERRRVAVFAQPNKWGYQLNVGNDTLRLLYNAYISRNGIYPPMGDAQRIEWERQLWVYLGKIYRTCHKVHLPDYDTQPLSEHVVGWQLTQLADMINYRLVADKAIKQLYGG